MFCYFVVAGNFQVKWGMSETQGRMIKVIRDDEDQRYQQLRLLTLHSPFVPLSTLPRWKQLYQTCHLSPSFSIQVALCWMFVPVCLTSYHLWWTRHRRTPVSCPLLSNSLAFWQLLRRASQGFRWSVLHSTTPLPSLCYRINPWCLLRAGMFTSGLSIQLSALAGSRALGGSLSQDWLDPWLEEFNAAP